MDGIDLAAVALIGVMAVFGARRGLVASVLSLGAVAVGALAGSRLAPHVLSGGAHSPYTPIAGLVGALVLALLLQVGAGIAGGAIRNTLRVSPLRAVDSFGGLLFGALTALAFAWVLAVAVLLLPGQTQLRDQVRSSAILSRLVAAVPPRPLLNALARIDPFPSITGPRAPNAQPDPAVLRNPLLRRVSGSVVRVESIACGIGYTGSGWVVRPGVVVTAAHVIAGADRVYVTTVEGLSVRVQPVVFDGHNDLALLQVFGLDLPPLALSEAREGSSGVALGFPGGGPFQAIAARVGQTEAFLARDYRADLVWRKITSLRARIRPGNSGGPLVDARGAVEGTIFARKDGQDVGYAVPTAVLRNDLKRRFTLASTGSCIG